MDDLSLSGTGVSTRVPPPFSSQPHMTDQQRAIVHDDISRTMRAVVRFVTSSYDAGSAAGRWAIHESRQDVEIDLEEASEVEVLDAILLAELRRKIWARPEPRRDVVYTDGHAKGKPMACVAPRDAVARVIPVKRSRPSSSGEGATRDWRISFQQCLAKIPKQCETALLDSASHAFTLVELANRLQDAVSTAARIKGGLKKVTHRRAEADAQVRVLRAQETEIARKLDALVRGDAYRAGRILLARVITSRPDREREIFGDLT